MFAKCVFPEDSFLEVSLLKSSSFGSLKNSDSEPELESGKSYHSSRVLISFSAGLGWLKLTLLLSLAFVVHHPSHFR